MEELRKEITAAQKKNKEMLSDKDTQIEDLRQQLEERPSAPSSISKRKVPQKMTMTGLPANVVKAKTKPDLKFKKPTATAGSSLETTSVTTTTTLNSQMTDKQLSYDNQMLTNELVVTTNSLTKTKGELKKC